MPTTSNNKEFHFGLDPDESIGTPFSLGDDVTLPTHKRVYYQGDKVKADPCPSNQGTVVSLNEPLDRSGKSYIAKAVCSNPSCDFVGTVRA